MIVGVHRKNLFYVIKLKLTYRKVLVKVLVSVLQYFLEIVLVLQYFYYEVLVLVLPILFSSIVNSPAANTLHLDLKSTAASSPSYGRMRQYGRRLRTAGVQYKLVEFQELL